mmetsp:Transcript_17144/g.32680  ORF Transcript_17144/g.32680 Transcript_17144/m.32680 type:complete len:1070 (+) Transcript_17144:2-3211(+)
MKIPKTSQETRDFNKSMLSESNDFGVHSTASQGHLQFFRMLFRLLPPFLLSVGLALFTKSFFLSRTSFDHRSSCDYGSAGSLLTSALGLSEKEVQFMRREGWLSDFARDGDRGVKGDYSDGCWVSRRVDSMVILVVDALRFDFARDHLPLSIGSRLSEGQQSHGVGEGESSHNQQRKQKHRARGSSQLFQFVADPPTVTMQRLKGLTTGGLPTFADISGSFGGASIDEDSWVEQLKNVPWNRRRHLLVNASDGNHALNPPQIAFVGDDTWVDLFPTQFDDSHPYPSFNTRDLDTVDNGCLMHLPRLLKRMVGLKTERDRSTNSSSFELIISHFLGVDHVGHTYGPNDPHMNSKLHQMDVSLANTLGAIDNAPSDSCIVALVLGDHGMTEDGNHGGGTSEEMNAGLFAHFSPGCDGDDDDAATKIIDGVDGREIGLDAARAFESINQIDLVPTISLLLGLPIPYANIGGLVPALLPKPRYSRQSSPSDPSKTDEGTLHIATALALNAAQVWRYLHEYSKSSRDLPSDQLKELKELLDSATIVYRDALSYSQMVTESESNLNGESGNYQDSTAFRQACGLFKLFLAQSTDLGKRVWTQFNEAGMMMGIGIMALAWVLVVPLWTRDVREEIVRIFSANHALINVQIESTKEIAASPGKEAHDAKTLMQSWQHLHRIEVAAAVLLMTFQCAILTFSNSYIEHEREVVTFSLSVLSLLILRRWYFAQSASVESPVYLPVLVAICSRLNDVFVTGHGLDPSIRLHPAHHSFAFMTSLVLLVYIRLQWIGDRSTQPRYSFGITSTPISEITDVFAMFCLALTWWEKRSRDHSRNGYIIARAAIGFFFVGMVHSIFCILRDKNQSGGNVGNRSATRVKNTKLALFRGMMLLVMVTGPSCSSTAVLVLLQCASICKIMESFGSKVVDAPVMAALWRLAIRSAFFGTNHHCSFNRLQYSAAFIATDSFHFVIAGSSLFFNTFGWEMIGSTLVLVLSRTTGRSTVWSWFRFYQWTEMLASCISVSVMKRHLMVWAIFAPRFMFAAVFTGFCLFLCFVEEIFDVINPFLKTKNNHSRLHTI